MTNKHAPTVVPDLNDITSVLEESAACGTSNATAEKALNAMYQLLKEIERGKALREVDRVGKAKLEAFMDLGDVVYKSLRKYRTCIQTDFNGMRLGEYWQSWSHTGGPANLISQYSRYILSKVRQYNAHLDPLRNAQVNPAAVTAEYNKICNSIRFYARRCLKVHTDLEAMNEQEFYDYLKMAWCMVRGHDYEFETEGIKQAMEDILEGMRDDYFSDDVFGNLTYTPNGMILNP